MPETGLEPAHQMAYAPKAYVYTNFTTRAYSDYIIMHVKKRDQSSDYSSESTDGNKKSETKKRGQGPASSN